MRECDTVSTTVIIMHYQIAMTFRATIDYIRQNSKGCTACKSIVTQSRKCIYEGDMIKSKCT